MLSCDTASLPFHLSPAGVCELRQGPERRLSLQGLGAPPRCPTSEGGNSAGDGASAGQRCVIGRNLPIHTCGQSHVLPNMPLNAKTL